MHSVHRPHTSAFERLCECFCFVIDFKALTGQCQYSHNFVPTYFIWIATHFVLKRLNKGGRGVHSPLDRLEPSLAVCGTQ